MSVVFRDVETKGEMYYYEFIRNNYKKFFWHRIYSFLPSLVVLLNGVSSIYNKGLSTFFCNITILTTKIWVKTLILFLIVVSLINVWVVQRGRLKYTKRSLTCIYLPFLNFILTLSPLSCSHVEKIKIHMDVTKQTFTNVHNFLSRLIRRYITHQTFNDFSYLVQIIAE